jgi:hypothetical protein
MFATHCVESGLALRGDVRLVPILETSSGGYEPLAGMITGGYDAYGGVDVEGELEAQPLIAELRRVCAPGVRPERDGRDVWNVLAQDVRSFRLAGRVLSYVLLDEGVATVMEDSIDADAMARIPERDVLDRPRSEHDRRMAAALLAWRTRLRPVWETFGGQYSAERGEIQPFVRAAREKYGGNPAMLAAIDENAEAWDD